MAQTELRRGRSDSTAINENIAANLASITVTGGTIDGVAITGGSITGMTDITVADGGTGASTAAAARNNLGTPSIESATFTVGTEATDVINVAVQLKDSDSADLTSRRCVYAYLSDDANGDGLTGTAPDTSVAIGTDGNIIDTHTAKSSFSITSNETGAFDLDITDTTGATWYLVVVVDGKLYVSDAITFTT